MLQKQSQHRTSIKGLGFILLCVLLSGCASRVEVRPTLASNTELGVDEGIIVARIVNTSAYPLPFNQILISPDNLNESDDVKPIMLKAKSVQTSGSTVFAATAKSGRYSLTGISSFHSLGEFWFSRQADAGASFGTFEIVPGRVTDLGSLIYYPKPQEVNYQDVIVRQPAAEMGEVLSKHFPYFSYKTENVQGWNDDGRDEERDDLFISVAQNPITYDVTFQSADDTTYFLGKLGVILSRSVNGDWDLDAVDTNLNLNDMDESNSGVLAVGGEEGRLFWKEPTGEWQDISLQDSSNISAVRFYDDYTIDVVSASSTELKIRRIFLREGRDELLNTYSYKKGWSHSDKIRNPKRDNRKNSKKNSLYGRKDHKSRRINGVTLSSFDGVEYLTIGTQSLGNPSVFADINYTTYQYSTDSWFIKEAESDFDLTSIMQAGNVRIGVKEAGFWSLTGRAEIFRYDEGTADWEEVSTHVRLCSQGVMTESGNCGFDKHGRILKGDKRDFTLRSAPWFKNAKEGVLIAGFSHFDFWTGERSKETKILFTRDGGKTWADTNYSLPQSYCISIVSEIKEKLVLSCDGATGDFYESLDLGKTWQHVRQQENI